MAGASSETGRFDAALSGAAMDTGDVFEIFVEVMQNKMSNRSLGFNFTFGTYKAQECRVIRLTKSILAKVRIGQLDDIRFVRLCAGGDVFGISTRYLGNGQTGTPRFPLNPLGPRPQDDSVSPLIHDHPWTPSHPTPTAIP